MIPTPKAKVGNSSFPGWPTHFEGRAITQLPLSKREAKFTEEFPGLIGRFTDGEREIILRWITEENRRVHPSSDCFQGIGYKIEPLPIWIDRDGNYWSSFKASNENESLYVYERTYDQQGNSWTDISSWYWAAIFGKTSSPWWSITVASTYQQKPD
jgi:hypothetical protein